MSLFCFKNTESRIRHYALQEEEEKKYCIESQINVVTPVTVVVC